MRELSLQTTATLLCLFCANVAHAQQPQPTAAVPKLVRFSGSFRPANGLPTQGVESVTLAVYRDQTGGTALWQEIQNVAVDSDGRYSVLMGATQNEGMPLDLFSSGEPRWLGAQFNRPGEVEQPRVLLVSVPYALKASDAETLGGKPASAYLLAAPTVGTDTAHESGVWAPVGSALATTTTPLASINPKALHPGTQNYIAKFDSSGNATLNSVMYESNGAVGLGTTQPGISLDVRTGALPQMGIAGTTDYLTFFASDVFGPAIYWDPAKDMRFGKGGSGLYNPFGFVEYMRIQSSTGNVGIGTQTPGSKLDVAGDINFSGSIRYQRSPVLQVPGGVSNNNIAVGLGALQSSTSGSDNTATGSGALLNNTTGQDNTAIGAGALGNNTVASLNTAVGAGALQSNTGGACCNTAMGFKSLFNNETGSDNTAIGEFALYSNTTGANNVAIGSSALQNNTTAVGSTAIGAGALGSTTGGFNTAIGYFALSLNTTGNNNIAIGVEAANSVSVGNSNNIHIGSLGSSGDSSTVRIGTPGTQTSFFVAGVNGVTTTNSAVPVLIDTTNGQLGVTSSSRRYKEDIEDMGAASHDLMRLRPVTFRYKQPFGDGSKPVQYGLIAEEVNEVYPDLVAHSADGQIETVKYQVLDSMLLNEVQRQQAEIGAQKDQLRKLTEQIAEQRQQNQSLLERLARLEAALASTSSELKVPSGR